jgi:non-specific protein-tyrosine kinase
MLWANLRYFTLSREIRSVLITSADRDEGKTTVAWGVGAAAASAGTRTLLIEADLRNPTFATRFNLPVGHGLTSVLAGDVILGDAIMRYRFPRIDHDPRSARSMNVLFAGPRPPDPSDLLQSQRMADFLREATDEYDLIVIDTPPMAAVSDAIPLITLVDGVIVVSRLGKTVRDHARRLRQQLDHLDAPMLGLVVNWAEEAAPYGYGYAYKGEPSTTASSTRRAPARSDGRQPAVADPGAGDLTPARDAGDGVQGGREGTSARSVPPQRSD